MPEPQLIIIGSMIIGFLIALGIIIGALIISRNASSKIEASKEILIKEIKNSLDKFAKQQLDERGDSYAKSLGNSLGISLGEFAKQQLDEKADSYLKTLGDSLGNSLGNSLSEFAKQQGEKDLAKYKRVIDVIKSRPEARIIGLAKLLGELED